MISSFVTAEIFRGYSYLHYFKNNNCFMRTQSDGLTENKIKVIEAYFLKCCTYFDLGKSILNFPQSVYKHPYKNSYIRFVLNSETYFGHEILLTKKYNLKYNMKVNKSFTIQLLSFKICSR